MCNASMGPSGDLHEALVHALMLVGQRPSHALGLNMAGLLLLDLTGTDVFARNKRAVDIETGRRQFYAKQNTALAWTQEGSGWIGQAKILTIITSFIPH